MSEKLKEQATTAGVQESREAEESCSDYLGEGQCTERARLETYGCIPSGTGTPKSEFRLEVSQGRRCEIIPRGQPASTIIL